jgi:hypothetical protein
LVRIALARSLCSFLDLAGVACDDLIAIDVEAAVGEYLRHKLGPVPLLSNGFARNISVDESPGWRVRRPYD